MTASQAENLDSQVHHQIPAMKGRNHGVYYSRISMHSNQCRIFAEKKLKINVKKGRRFDRSTVIFKFRSKKISICFFYTIVKRLMRYWPKTENIYIETIQENTT